MATKRSRSPATREKRLEQLRRCSHKRLLRESAESREIRLADLRRRAHERLAKESPETREKRLADLRRRAREKLAIKSPALWQKRLPDFRRPYRERLSQESPGTWDNRLSHLQFKSESPPALGDEADTEERALVVAVEQRPVLWDHRHILYKKRQATKNAWEEIAHLLNSNSTQVKNRWKHIRDYHRQLMKKPSGPPERNWRLYSLLRFLKTIPKKKNYVYEHEAKYDECQVGTSSNSDFNTNKFQALFVSAEWNNAVPLDDDYLDKILEIEKGKVKLLEKEVQPNDNYLFFKSIIPSLKSLPPEKKIFVKMKFQELLLSELGLQGGRS